MNCSRPSPLNSRRITMSALLTNRLHDVRRKVRLTLFLFSVLALVCGHALAQTRATDGATPAGIAPGAPSGSYSLSGFDNVNLFNGRMNFQLPLLSVGGRGGVGYR